MIAHQAWTRVARLDTWRAVGKVRQSAHVGRRINVEEIFDEFTNRTAARQRIKPHIIASQTETGKAERDLEAAGKHGANAIKEGFKGASENARKGFGRAASGAKTAVNKSKQGVVNTWGGTKASAFNFKGQISSAYKAGATSDTYTRGLSAKPSIAQKTGSWLKAPFTSTSYVAGHTISNSSHGVREARFHMAPSTWGKVLAGATAVWLGALALAGASTRHLGFLAQPIPHTAGFSLPTVAWHLGESSVAIMALAIAIRVGFALVAKVQEWRAAPKTVAVEDTTPAADASESANNVVDGMKETVNKATTSEQATV